MATPVGNSVGLTGNPYADVLIQGSSWTFGGGPHFLTYSFNVNDGPGGAWTANWIAAVNQALADWASVANIQFQQIASGNFYYESAADLAFTLTGNDLTAQAVALGIFPDPAFATSVIAAADHDRSSYPRPEGDVF